MQLVRNSLRRTDFMVYLFSFKLSRPHIPTLRGERRSNNKKMKQIHQKWILESESAPKNNYRYLLISSSLCYYSWISKFQSFFAKGLLKQPIQANFRLRIFSSFTLFVMFDIENPHGHTLAFISLPNHTMSNVALCWNDIFASSL